MKSGMDIFDGRGKALPLLFLCYYSYSKYENHPSDHEFMSENIIVASTVIEFVMGFYQSVFTIRALIMHNLKSK